MRSTMSDPNLKSLLFSPDPKFERELERKMPEMVTLSRLLRNLEGRARIVVEDVVPWKGRQFPVISVTMGSEDPAAPTLGIFGGVHGLERIGSDVVIAWLQSLHELSLWDETLRDRLQKSRIVFMPIVNPIGVFEMRRSNGNGVDLMRNSPVRADEPPWLLGGHNYSPKLPWYSPIVNAESEMEIESRAVCRVVEREMFRAKCSIAIDVHSGFGSVDRLWFPWSKSKAPPPHLEEISALKRLFDRSYPNHFYEIEPQAKQYTLNGDLWDWLYERQMNEVGRASGGPTFLPFTLELGSWIWLKKNPRQLFSSLGGFHPIQPHRLKRILRRHLTLFDFLHRAALSSDPWLKIDEDSKRQLRRRALDLWYKGVE